MIHLGECRLASSGNWQPASPNLRVSALATVTVTSILNDPPEDSVLISTLPARKPY